MSIFNVSECNVAQLIGETSRFMFHVFLIHITTCIIEGRHGDMFSNTLFKTLLVTAIAIILYHIFFRKIVEPKIKKMKSICVKNKYKRPKHNEDQRVPQNTRKDIRDRQGR